MAQSKYRILLEVVDANGVKALQKKLNQWATTGLLIKFNTTPMGDKVLFEILLNKG